MRVDVSGLFRPQLSGGLARRRLVEAFSRAGQVQAWLARVGLPPALPELAAVRAVVGDPVPWGVVGSPGAVRAVCALGSALGAAPVRIVQPGSPPAGTPAAWLALLGPDWVPDTVDALLATGARVIVAGPPSDEPVEPPPGGAWLDDASAGDGRFGALGASAFAAALLAGIDAEAAWSGAQAARAVLAERGAAEHPAYAWALGLVGLVEELGAADAVHLHADPALAELAGWAAASFGSMLAGSVDGDAAYRRVGGRMWAAPLGDEEVAEMLYAGAGGVHVVLWERDGDPRAEAEAQRATRRGVPLIRVRLGDLGAGTLGWAQALALHAACAGAALLDRDPTRMETLDPG